MMKIPGRAETSRPHAHMDGTIPAFSANFSSGTRSSWLIPNSGDISLPDILSVTGKRRRAFFYGPEDFPGKFQAVFAVSIIALVDFSV